MSKLYPRELPRKRRLTCNKLARRTDWHPMKRDMLLREFECIFGHKSYYIVTKRFVEVETYLEGVFVK